MVPAGAPHPAGRGQPAHATARSTPGLSVVSRSILNVKTRSGIRRPRYCWPFS